MLEVDAEAEARGPHCTSAASGVEAEAPVDEDVSVVKAKKHSGPRKRRPKKKKSEAATPVHAHVETPRTRDKRLDGPAVTRRSTTTTFSSAVSDHCSPPLRALAVPFVPPPPGGHNNGSNDPTALTTSPRREAEEDRAFWTRFVIEAAENERARRLRVLRQLQEDEAAEIRRRRAWAIAAIEREQQAMMRELFLDNMTNTPWFQSTISGLTDDYEVVCPNSWFGCTFSCMLQDLEAHVASCGYRQVPDTLDQVVDASLAVDLASYDVVCPNAMLGCSATVARDRLAEHLTVCPVSSRSSREKEWQERQAWQQNVILLTEEERQRRMRQDDRDRFSFGHLQRLYEEQTTRMQMVLHEEITRFAEDAARLAAARRPNIERAIQELTRELRSLWGDDVVVQSYGSFATGLQNGHSDVDVVVFGIDESCASETCVSVLAEHLTNLGERTYRDISAITRASIPLVKVGIVVQGEDDPQGQVAPIPFDITFDSPSSKLGGPKGSHNGVASAALLQRVLPQFYGLQELTLVLKHFLAMRGLNDPYVGGLSSYGLVLMILYVLREQGAVVLKSEDVVTNGQAEPDQTTNERCEAQRNKGLLVADEIIRQARQRQHALSANADNAVDKRVRRPLAWELLQHADDSSSSDGSRSRPSHVLGKLLMDVLQFYGNDFRQHFDKIAVLSTTPEAKSTSSPVSSSSSPLFQSPVLSGGSGQPFLSPLLSSYDACVVIQDPLHAENNVGKSCYRISQVLREFSDFLSFLTALIVRGRVVGSAPVSANSANSMSKSMGQRILNSVFEMKSAAPSPREIPNRASFDRSSPGG